MQAHFDPKKVDTCEYCQRSYHPMPRYTPQGQRNGRLIYVCHIRFDEDGIDLNWQECREKAAADGYELRMDLTPKR